MDLTRTRNGDNDSEVVVTVGFKGSQFSLGQDLSDDTKPSKQSQSRRARRHGSAPPTDHIVEVEVHNPRVKPDVVHWKAKVWGRGM